MSVPGGAEADFLAPEPLIVLPDLSPKIRDRLDDYQLDLIGELAAIPESALCAVFGSAGRTLRARARGIDPRPVLPPERQAEFHAEHSLATDTNDLTLLHALLRALTDRLGGRLRRRGLVARRVRIELTYADHTTSARAVPLALVTLDADLWEAARRCFTLANARRLAVRTVAITLERLEEENGQMELWGVEAGLQAGEAAGQPSTLADCRPRGILPRCPAAPLPRRLQHALDQIRGRWGARGIARGVARPLARPVTNAAGPP